VLLRPPADRVGLEGRPERVSGLELEAVLREDCVGSRPESLDELPSRE